MMRTKQFLVFTVISVIVGACLFQAGCKNVINGLIPNNEQKILKFDLKNVERFVCSTKTELKDKHIVVYVPAGTDVTKLLPEAILSRQAILFPITLRYLQEAFPQTDMIQLANYASNAADIGALDKWFYSLYEQNPGFNIPPLVFPINFLSPVTFAVIGGQGGLEMYTVKVMNDDGTDPATGFLPPGIPAEKNILTFTIPNHQIGTSVIAENTIDVIVKSGTDVRSLVPKITASDGALVIPVTREYLEPFCEENGFDFLSVLSGFITAPDQEAYLRALFAPIDISKLKMKIDRPIDFTNRVAFAVLGKDKEIKLYMVKVMNDDGTDPATGLLPPGVFAEKNILTFTVPEHQIGTSIIGTNRIDFTVKAGTEVRSLLPDITVSGISIVIPVTREYLEPFCKENGLDIVSIMHGFVTAPDQEAYLQTFFAPLDIARLKVNIDKPIDFTNPVMFAVLGKDKAVKLYTAHCNIGTEKSYLENFAVTKFKNPALVNDGEISIDQTAKTITATLFYPVEYAAAQPDVFHLLCDAAFIGSSAVIEYKGTEYSLTGKIPLQADTPASDPYDLGSAEAVLKIEQGGVKTDYRIRFIFKEDPDTVRSITDFRFEKFYNNGIKASVMAAISNDGHEGTITATVLYDTADKPEFLTPSFISAGTVSMDGAEQHSTVDRQDFRNAKVYVCTSKNGAYTRRYTVKVTFIKVESQQPVLKSFKFPCSLNRELSHDGEGRIDETTASVYVEVQYTGTQPPGMLIPVFAATGTVTVNGLTQSSGFSKQNFKYTVYYKVTAADDPSVSKIYGVHVTYNFTADAGCELLSFSFLAVHNPSLTADIDGFISTYSNNVYAVVPKTADIAHLKPSFTAKGRVTVDDVEQTSGTDTVNFSAPVEYWVTSENGIYRKKYTVKIQKTGDVIYVKSNATGRNNGLTWEDAFINLDLAFEKAKTLPEESIPEIWVMKDYSKTNLRYKINRAFILRGGFEGVEAAADQRNQENKTVFSSTFSSDRDISGSVLFDSIEFNDADNLVDLTWNRRTGRENILTFANCNFVNSTVMLTSSEQHPHALNLIKTKIDENSRLDTSTHVVHNNNPLERITYFYGAVTVTDCTLEGTIRLYTGAECTIDRSTIKIKTEDMLPAFAAETLTVTQSEIEDLCKLQTSRSVILNAVRSPFGRCDINVIMAFDVNVTVENSNMVALNIRSMQRGTIEKLSLRNSSIQTIKGSGKIDSFECTGGCSGDSIHVPTPRVTIKDASFKIVDTRCDFLADGGLETNVSGLKTETFKCGAIDSLSETQLASNISSRYYSNTDREAHGIQTIKNSTFKQCFVYGGDSIIFTDNTVTGTRENWQWMDGYENRRKYLTIKDYDTELYPFQFVILKNANTPGSTIRAENITAACGWFRGETNNLTARKVGPAAGKGFSRAEFYGYTRADIQECNFKDILPVRASCYGDVHYYESFIAGGGEVRVTNNSFTYSCPALIGAADNFDIGGNNFSDGETPPAVAAQDGRNTGQYFELTLYYPKQKTLSNMAFAALNLDAENRVFRHILNTPDTEGMLTLNNCYFASGLAINREKVTVDNCKFGASKPFTNSQLYCGTIDIRGKADTIIKNLTIRYYDVFSAALLADHPGLYGTGFVFIKNRDDCTGKTEITGCTFVNFTRFVAYSYSYNRERKMLITACTFTYEGAASIGNKKIYKLETSILYSANHEFQLSGCKFETTEGPYAYIDSGFDIKAPIYPDMPLVNVCRARNFICTDNNFQNIPCNYNLFCYSEDSDTKIKIKNCKFNAHIHIADNFHGSDITVADCSFDRRNPKLECASLYISHYALKNLQNKRNVMIERCTFAESEKEVIFLNPYGAASSSENFVPDTITYYPSRIDIIDCQLARNDVFLGNYRRKITGYNSSNEPIYSYRYFGPAMVMFTYSTAVDKQKIKSYVNIRYASCGAVFLNLPHGEMPSDTSPYKIKGWVNSP